MPNPKVVVKQKRIVLFRPMAERHGFLKGSFSSFPLLMMKPSPARHKISSSTNQADIFCSTWHVTLLFARALEGAMKNFSMHSPGYLFVAFCTSYGNEEHHAKGMNDLGGERE